MHFFARIGSYLKSLRVRVMERNFLISTAVLPFALRDAEGVGQKPTEGSYAAPAQGGWGLRARVHNTL